MSQIHILDNSTYEDVIKRIENISPDTLAKWGKMTPAQMIKHTRLAMEVPMEKWALKPNWIVKFFWGKKIRESIINDEMYSHSLRTAPQFITDTEQLDFQTELNTWKSTLNEFVNWDDSNFEKFKHPIYGKLTPRQVRKAQWKHLHHHFNQFGI